jgi:hypothetical protein
MQKPSAVLGFFMFNFKSPPIEVVFTAAKDGQGMIIANVISSSAYKTERNKCHRVSVAITVNGKTVI